MKSAIDHHNDKPTSSPLTVFLHRWTKWPNRCAPNHDTLMIPLKMLKTISDQPNTTCIVHSSAGIGRTGTVVAIEICIQRLRAAKSLDVASVSEFGIV